ncbi:MAG: hypothetical protein NC121_17310 [Blautia sp.]|nr:hypothetical protein [Blautia sp.]
MEKVLIICEGVIPESYLELLSVMKEYFESCGWPTEIFCIEAGMDESACKRKLLDTGWKYICTLDMAGFQMDTVLGGPSYNIIHAKQIHIVINEESFMPYRHEEFALNLYMFMPDTMQGCFAERYYRPNLFFYKLFELGEHRDRDSNREELIRILETTRKDCEMPCE